MINSTQVLEAIKADKSLKFNLPHMTITNVEKDTSATASSEKHWVVSFTTSWGHEGQEVIRVEIEDGEIEIW